ncbi:MAG: hypothetical protein WAN35_13280 [Terracidiphilus sp.]
MIERLIDRIPFAKFVTVLAIVLGISLGLCGFTYFISSGFDGNWIGLGILELVVIVLSAAGLALTLLVVVTLLIFRGFSKKVSQLEIFPKEEDDTKIDRNE